MHATVEGQPECHKHLLEAELWTAIKFGEKCPQIDPLIEITLLDEVFALTFVVQESVQIRWSILCRCIDGGLSDLFGRVIPPHPKLPVHTVTNADRNKVASNCRVVDVKRDVHV